MAKITIQEIKDLGFPPELFRQAGNMDLDAYIQGVIDEQSAILLGRVGTASYNSVTSPTKEYVKRAEKCLVAVELLKRRINIILSNAIGAGQEIDISAVEKQRDSYRKEAEEGIEKIAAGVTTDAGSDMFFGYVETSHFGD